LNFEDFTDGGGAGGATPEKIANSKLSQEVHFLRSICNSLPVDDAVIRECCLDDFELVGTQLPVVSLRLENTSQYNSFFSAEESIRKKF
jgi:hypothetical protein